MFLPLIYFSFFLFLLLCTWKLTSVNMDHGNDLAAAGTFIITVFFMWTTFRCISCDNRERDCVCNEWCGWTLQLVNWCRWFIAVRWTFMSNGKSSFHWKLDPKMLAKKECDNSQWNETKWNKTRISITLWECFIAIMRIWMGERKKSTKQH